jgi:phosphoadenosine phosphosulfate reductase
MSVITAPDFKLGLQGKVDEAIYMLHLYEPKNGYALQFSGGKDSCVLYDLAKRAGVKFGATFSNTTVEAPETYKFIREFYPEVRWITPPMSMRAAIIKKGFPPTRLIRFCCDVLKENTVKQGFILTGIRRAESVKRSKRRALEVSTAHKGLIMLHPIFHFTTDEIWEYTHAQGLPVNPLYAEGRKRIGCVMCPMQGSKGMKRDAERWPKIARLYRNAFQAMWEVHNHKWTNTTHKFKSGDCIYQWWIEYGGDETPDAQSCEGKV